MCFLHEMIVRTESENVDGDLERGHQGRGGGVCRRRARERLCGPQGVVTGLGVYSACATSLREAVALRV